MSLRIKLSVVRVARSPDKAGRVRYRQGNRALIPEAIVLRRWKDRSTEKPALDSGITFDGCRLPSGTRTLVKQRLADGLPWDGLSNPMVLARHAEKSRVMGNTLRAPEPTKFAAMNAFLQQRGVLRAVVERERDLKNPGLPDLFLYRLDRDKRVHGGRFVEVKRWDKPKTFGNVFPLASKTDCASFEASG